MGTHQTVSASASTAYAISGFFKAGTSTWVILAGYDGSTTPRTWFNLISGTIGTVETGMSNATIQNYGNGWYRCSVVRTTGASATSLRWQMSHSTANETTATSATLTLTVWGAQIETGAGAGAFATSYIPTTSAAVTRAADVAAVNTLSPWFNATEGTLYVQAAEVGISADTYNEVSASFTPTPANLDDEVTLYGKGDVASSGAIIRAATAIQFLIVAANNTTVAGVTYKQAVVYETNYAAYARNGAIIGSSTTITNPTGLTKLNLGGQPPYPLTACIWLKRIIYYPRRVTNTELQTLTA